MNNQEHQRDKELENIAGNLLVAEHQVERLRERLVSTIGSVHPYVSETDNRKMSSHIFKSNGTWVKVSVIVEKMTTTDKTDDILWIGD